MQNTQKLVYINHHSSSQVRSPQQFWETNVFVYLCICRCVHFCICALVYCSNQATSEWQSVLGDKCIGQMAFRPTGPPYPPSNTHWALNTVVHHRGSWQCVSWIGDRGLFPMIETLPATPPCTLTVSPVKLYAQIFIIRKDDMMMMIDRLKDDFYNWCPHRRGAVAPFSIKRSPSGSWRSREVIQLIQGEIHRERERERIKVWRKQDLSDKFFPSQQLLWSAKWIIKP